MVIYGNLSLSFVTESIFKPTSIDVWFINSAAFWSYVLVLRHIYCMVQSHRSYQCYFPRQAVMVDKVRITEDQIKSQILLSVLCYEANQQFSIQHE